MRASKNLSEGLEQVLLVIKDLIPCERIYILETDCKPVRILTEWTAPGLPSASLIFSHLEDDHVRNVDNVMKSHDVAIISSEEFRDLYPSSYEDMIHNGLRNTLAAPFYEDGVMFGNLCLDNFDMNTALDAREFMQALAFFIASEIQTRRLMERLSILSNTDPLTGIQNRNAMNHKLEKLHAAPCSLGVVIADINGLKMVNDNQGHAEGDQMIKDAADILTQCFDSKDIYRTGGDEFIVLISGLNEESFMNQVRKLDVTLDGIRNFSMAYGFLYRSLCSDPEALIRETDKAMYKNKKAYYDKWKTLNN